MNFESACNILGIDTTQKGEITIEHIKKQYRLHALKYHPDKNKEPDACAKFQRINDAYLFCMKYM
jgi:DnaJ-class molecular chaperone